MEFKEGDLCGAFYEDLVGKEYEGHILNPWDRCPDPDCQKKISAHQKRGENIL